MALQIQIGFFSINYLLIFILENNKTKKNRMASIMEKLIISFLLIMFISNAVDASEKIHENKENSNNILGKNNDSRKGYKESYEEAQKTKNEDYFSQFTTGEHPIIKFEGFDKNEKTKLKTILKEIFNNPIGKLLAYKILNEINRLSDFSTPERNTIREKNKHIKFVKANDEMFGYNSATETQDTASIDVYFPWLESSTDFQVVNQLNNQKTGFEIALENIYDKRQALVWIFHEMLHWYHCLHDAEKFDNYAIGRDSETKKHTIVTHPVSKYIYEKINEGDEAIKISTFPWRGKDREEDGGECCDFEEMRTIVGAEFHEDDTDGDCLSENAYRCSIGLPMRFGHGGDSYTEGKSVIEHAKISAQKSSFLEEWKNFSLSKANRYGLGNMSIPISDELNNFVKDWRK